MKHSTLKGSADANQDNVAVHTFWLLECRGMWALDSPLPSAGRNFCRGQGPQEELHRCVESEAHTEGEEAPMERSWQEANDCGNSAPTQ